MISFCTDLNDSTTESLQSLRNATLSSENTTLVDRKCRGSSVNAVPLSSRIFLAIISDDANMEVARKNRNVSLGSSDLKHR